MESYHRISIKFYDRLGVAYRITGYFGYNLCYYPNPGIHIARLFNNFIMLVFSGGLYSFEYFLVILGVENITFNFISNLDLFE